MTIIRLFLLCHWLPKTLADHRCQSNATPIQVVVIVLEMNVWKSLLERHLLWMNSKCGLPNYLNIKTNNQVKLKEKDHSSGKLVLVKSVRKTCGHRMKFCVQRGFGELHSTSKWKGKLQSTVRYVLTSALLASFP